MTTPKTIGLIGGIGPGATLLYYAELARAFAKRGPHPPLYLSHADANHAVDFVSRGDIEGLARYLAGQGEALVRAGAEFVTVSSVTTHICAPQLRDMISVPLLDMIDIIRAELRARGVRRVALMSTRFVAQSDLYGRLDDFEVIRASDETLEFVHANYFKIVVAASAEGSGADIEGLRRVGRDLTDRGAEAVVLAGTELSLAFDEATCGFPALDCARLHVDAIVAEAYGERTS